MISILFFLNHKHNNLYEKLGLACDIFFKSEIGFNHGVYYSRRIYDYIPDIYETYSRRIYDYIPDIYETIYMHTVSETDFRFKKYITTETYIFR